MRFQERVTREQNVYKVPYRGTRKGKVVPMLN